METANKHKRHIGKNISRIRSLKGIKQESLAIDLGLSQTEVSVIENSAYIEEELLFKIANILNVTPGIIKKFDENFAVLNVNNSIDNTTITESSQGIHQIFNPLEQVVELYERLLASEQEKLELLKKNK